MGRSIAMFYPQEDGAGTCVSDRLQEADRSGWALDEGWRLQADGTRFWGSCLIAPLNPADEATTDRSGYSLILRDITDRRSPRSLAPVDLQRPPDRHREPSRVLRSGGTRTASRAHTPHPVSLVMIDADHFKRVNDSYGHAAGDAVLRHPRRRCSSRRFARPMSWPASAAKNSSVLLPGSPLEGAAAVAGRFCETVAAQAVDVDGRSIRYTVSAGVAVIDDGIMDLDALIKRADAALYAAKTRGRNRVECWSPALAATVSAPLLA
ncbi:MAG: GGDEF domain-containing protein [Burkholderiales bacterium]|nr:GGDEF domain-containing protein [Burkholderiales bacterium]